MSKQPDFDDEREWRAQESALHPERGGPSAGGDRIVDEYRLVACALRRPPLTPVPSDFAARTAAYAEREVRLAGERVEVWLERSLVTLLVLAGVATVTAYSGEALRRLASSLPEPLGLGALASWGLAIAACVAISWAIELATKR